MQPILERGGLKAGRDFYLAFSPEREDPGNVSHPTKSIPKVVGADDPTSIELANALYGAIVARTIPVSSMKTAEAVKLTENIFRAVNIALVNELKVVYDAMQDFVGTAPLNLVYVADLARMSASDRTEQRFYSAIDTGFISQNVYLFCASEGLATVVRGLVDRRSLAKLMQLRPQQRVIVAQTVGYPKD